ncbi:26S proteasome non-ATPase regulatory subunit 13 [Blomia tropicalis]|nr:26S proteasome non-ATPase regulatory subunit 13 [Blomia tropicalis]
MSTSVSDYLAKQQQVNANSPLLSYFVAFEELYNKKLYHQLTIKLLQFIQNENPKNLVELYENFISDFETRIKHLSLVEMSSRIIDQIPLAEAKLQFIEKIQGKVKNDVLSNILCNIIIGQIKLSSGDFKGTKEIIETNDSLIDSEMGITTIHARFYQLASDYYQKVGNHAEYYHNALRYLGCCGTAGVDISESDEVLAQRAFTLALAAILGKDVYNFGELLLHPILKKLKPGHVYMRDMLNAFNSGNISLFDELKPKWSTQLDLSTNEIDMRTKICLLCLMELAFSAPSGVLTFKNISDSTRLPIGDVELLVMKALSKGLVKGNIDEVESKVTITWVQPRVLNKNQISNMKGRLESWIKDVNEFSSKLETRAQEIIA